MRSLVLQKKVAGVDGDQVDFSRGIMQTIGFKEFDAYLQGIEQGLELEQLDKLKHEGLGF